MKRGLLVDLDGTLCDSLEGLRAAYRAFLAGFGAEGDEAEFALLNGPPLDEVVRILIRRRSLVGDAAELTRRYRSLAAEAHDAAPPAEGAAETLESLRLNGWSVAVVTSAAAEDATAWLRRTGLSPRVDCVVGGGDVQRGKPHPGPYLEAARRLGCAPGDCLAVEELRAGGDVGPGGGRADAPDRAGRHLSGLGSPAPVPRPDRPPGRSPGPRGRSRAMTAPKVLFVGRTIGHFSYYESVLRALLARGAEVELVFDRGQSRKWKPGDRAVSEFVAEHPALKVGWSVRRSDPLRQRLFQRRELRSYRSYLVRKDAPDFYVARWRSYLGPTWRTLADKPLFRALLTSPPAGAALRMAEAGAPADPGIVEFIRARAPDVVVASPLNMRFSEETDYIKAARRLGLPTAALTQTWDSLTTKGLIQILPDRLFVWNAFQRASAIGIHHVPPGRICVAGAPFLDKWFSPPTGLPSREAFCAEHGFDPDRPILLYLGSSENIAKDETWLVERLHTGLQPIGAQLLVRPHPANTAIYDRLDLPGLTVWPRGGALPETRQAFSDLRATFNHAAAAVGVNTSGMIDSVLADLPTYSIRIARYGETQAATTHFRDLEAADAMTVLPDEASFLAAFERLLMGEDQAAAGRRAFALAFARPRGLEREAGDVIAEEVLQMAERR